MGDRGDDERAGEDDTTGASGGDADESAPDQAPEFEAAGAGEGTVDESGAEETIATDGADDDSDDAPDLETAGDGFGDDIGPPEDDTDEDEEPPEWVEEAKRKEAEARQGRGGEAESTQDETADAETAEDAEADEADADDETPTDSAAEGAAGTAAGSSAAGGAPKGTPAGVQSTAAGAGGSGMIGGATAPDDQEMPLTEHVEEMALRFMAVGLVVVGVGAITLFYADELINFLWYSFLGPGPDTCLEGSFLAGELTVSDACPGSVSPRVYHPLALVLARLKVASLVGLIAALPVAVYQTYRFMRPGLYPRERRYYLAAVPTSLVLATVGVSFAYFAILPAMFSYFTNYSEQAAEIAFGLTETFNLIVLMIGFFALVFQIPLLVMLAIMMGVTTRQWLEDRRLYFWGGFAAVAFVFSPDPTGMAPLMVALTMIGLFEGTLFLLRWTDSDSPLFSPVAFAERRPYAWALALAAGYLASAAPVPGSYYESLPGVVRDTLAYNGLVEMTPIITALVLVGLFELAAYAVRNYSRNVQVWRVVNSSRFPYYMVALVAGYFASPAPPGLQVAQEVTLPTTEAVALIAGLVVGFELLILALRWRKRRMESAD